MQYKIEPGALVITADPEDLKRLKELKEEHENFVCDDVMYEVFERLVCNSELEWIDPADTGDLTDAPMLGILGETEKGLAVAGYKHVGFWDGYSRRCPILSRWAFMSYQVISVQEVLLRDGKVRFLGGDLR